MPYVNPKPKLELVKAGVRLEPSTLELVDKACAVLGLTRGTWIRTLVHRELVPLAKRADEHMRKCKGGLRGPLGQSESMVKVAGCLTKSRPQRKGSKRRP